MASVQQDLPSGDVARRTVHAIAWNYVGWFLGKLTALVSTAVLARLLTPEDFGVVGLATVAIAYLAVLQDLGLGSALIQRREDVDEAADTVFTINVIVGVVTAALVALAAPLISGFFDEPRLTSLVRVLSLSLVFNGLATTHIALLERDLAFRRKAVPDVGGAVLKSAVAIACAIAGLGAWALVIGHVVGSAAVAVLSWIVWSWRPTIRVHRRILGALGRFGGAVIVADVVHALVANLDYLIVGKVLGGTALGIYLLAYRLPELLLLGVVGVLSRAVFPALASVQDRAGAMRRGFLATLRFVPIAVVPIALGLIVAADPIVRVFLGEQWLEAIPVMRVVAASALVSTLMVSDGDVYKANGRPDILARFAALKLTLLIPALLIAVDHGLVWVAAAHLATTVVVKLLRARSVLRMLGCRWREVWESVRPVVVPAMALVASSVFVLVMSREWADWMRLGSTAVVGAAAYAVTFVHREPDTIGHLRELLRTTHAGRAA